MLLIKNNSKLTKLLLFLWIRIIISELVVNKKKIMKKKIYIAGCGGMLGEAFYTQFKNEYELKCTDKV